MTKPPPWPRRENAVIELEGWGKARGKVEELLGLAATNTSMNRPRWPPTSPARRANAWGRKPRELKQAGFMSCRHLHTAVLVDQPSSRTPKEAYCGRHARQRIVDAVYAGLLATKNEKSNAPRATAAPEGDERDGNRSGCSTPAWGLTVLRALAALLPRKISSTSATARVPTDP